jgi:hypothetical protein
MAPAPVSAVELWDLICSSGICAPFHSDPPQGEFWTTQIDTFPFATCEAFLAATVGTIHPGLTTFQPIVPDPPSITSVGDDRYEIHYQFRPGQTQVNLAKPEWPGMTIRQRRWVDNLLYSIGRHEIGHASLVGYVAAAAEWTEVLNFPLDVVELNAQFTANQLASEATERLQVLQNIYDAASDGGQSQDRFGGTNAMPPDFTCGADVEITWQEYEVEASIANSPGSSGYLEIRKSNELLPAGSHRLYRRHKGITLEQLEESFPPLGYGELEMHGVADWDSGNSVAGNRSYKASSDLTVMRTNSMGWLLIDGSMATKFEQLQGSPLDLGHGEAHLDIRVKVEVGYVDVEIVLGCGLTGGLSRNTPNPGGVFLWADPEECAQPFTSILAPGLYTLKLRVGISPSLATEAIPRNGSYEVTFSAH